MGHQIPVIPNPTDHSHNINKTTTQSVRESPPSQPFLHPGERAPAIRGREREKPPHTHAHTVINNWIKWEQRCTSAQNTRQRSLLKKPLNCSSETAGTHFVLAAVGLVTGGLQLDLTAAVVTGAYKIKVR